MNHKTYRCIFTTLIMIIASFENCTIAKKNNAIVKGFRLVSNGCWDKKAYTEKCGNFLTGLESSGVR